MHRTLTYGLALFLNGAFAQTLLPDSQATLSVLTEIRQLRHDLQTTAATIQRVQIVMYRLQAEAALMDATQRLDQARGGCTQGQMQRKRLAAQIEQAETRKRNAQNPSDQKAAEEMLSNLASSGESVGDVAGSVRVLTEEKVKLPAGGIKRALLLFFRFEGVDERATFIVDPVVQDFLDAFPS